MKAVRTGLLLSILVLGLTGQVGADEGQPDHEGAGKDQVRRTLVLPNPQDRYNEALSACLLERPVPERKQPKIIEEVTPPGEVNQPLAETKPEGGGNGGGNGGGGNGGGDAKPPGNDAETIKLLSSALSKCTPCHAPKFTAGATLKDTTFEFLESTKSGSPGQKKAGGILGALNSVKAMAGVNAKLSAAEKAALQAWQSAQN